MQHSPPVHELPHLQLAFIARGLVELVAWQHPLSIQQPLPEHEAGGHLHPSQFAPLVQVSSFKQLDILALEQQSFLEVQHPNFWQQPVEGLQEPEGHIQLDPHLQKPVDNFDSISLY